MVAHNGSDYLPRTLSALADQTRPVDRAIGVDTGSRDNSRALLERSMGAASVVSHDRGKSGMGAAVSAGLAAPAARKASTEGGRQEWIWLLHDDAAPAPEALAELLGAVERAPSVTVAGCKQLDWHSERRLVDVGLSTSRWAERLTLIDADELDQGQYDGRSDTFAVNSAGMLVRRDIWEQLGGFDPALPGSGDDVDFCWRNRLAGHRVVVVPAARMFHVSHRPHALGNPAAARKAQVHLRLKHAPAWMVPVHAVGALLGSLFRLVVSIALKDPGHGITQFLATIAALGRPRAVVRARRTARQTRRIRRSVIRKLQTPRREVWSHRRSLMEAIGSDGSQADDLEQDPLAHQPSGDASDDFAALATTKRGWVGNGALAAVIIASVASLLGLAGLFRADAVAGGALIPVSSALGDIWNHASNWWITLGAGLPGKGDPFGYVLWLIGVLGGGDGNAAMAWLLLLGTPLSALTAWFAAGGLTVRRRLRLTAALFWAAAPALQAALNQGRVGALVAHVMIPLFVLALLRATGSAVGHGRFSLPAPADRRGDKPPVRPGINGTPSWTAAAAAGLAMAVVTAAAPSLLVPATAVVVFCGVVLGRRGRTVWWALLPSAALFVPFGLSVLDKPRALLADPGLPLGFDAAPLWQQILGQPLEFAPDKGLDGLPYFQDGTLPWALLLALLLAVPVLALAVAGLFSGHRATKAKVLWAAALVALAGGWLASHVAVAMDADTLVTPFTGPVVSAASFALLGAALLGAEQLLTVADKAAAGPARRKTAVRSALAFGMVLLLVGPLAGMAAWSARNLLRPATVSAAGSPAEPPAVTDTAEPGDSGWGTHRLVEAASPRTLPATAIDRGTGPEQTRTLLISTGENGTFDAALMRGAGTTLDGLSAVAAARNILGAPGAETVRDDDDVTTAVRRSVATLVAGQGVDPRSDLEQLGVGFVVLRSADTAAQLTASRMDAVPGLVAVGQTDVGWLWRVTPLNQPVLQPADIAHRVRIVNAQGATVALVPSAFDGVDAPVPAGPEGRLAVLAERADPGWSAWLDGRKLTSTTSEWSQAFTLPASGGQLTIRYENPWAPWAGIAQGVVFGLTIMLAIPMPARRPRTGLSRDEGSLRKEQQNA
ncbi:glycosyltransferase family 2 protein [Arthrobacter nitrophenolicus]|uniref:Glycosyltransferase family 2 protein n=1 Tax=Arthrobacter nitrophenolicus TaxID=683150 RepID=A0A4R5XRY2_9MICC|nr:glycosyltransferase family 2 protein [Arthrobacter nitrophenolicus]TDL33596.1 glycosyltransferase family 2 protein [Arthrobacter nitrophenolicus]